MPPTLELSLTTLLYYNFMWVTTGLNIYQNTEKYNLILQKKNDMERWLKLSPTNTDIIINNDNYKMYEAS